MDASAGISNIAYQPLSLPHAPSPLKKVKVLAIIQLVIGILSFLLSIGPAFQHLIWLAYTCPGIGAGGWIIATGIIGLVHSRKYNNYCLNRVYLAFSIVSTIGSGIASMMFIISVRIMAAQYVECEEFCQLGLGIMVPLLIMMCVEFFVSIFAAVFCCQGCCGQNIQSSFILQQPHVMMIPQDGGQFVPHSGGQFVSQPGGQFVSQSGEQFVPQTGGQFVPQYIAQLPPQSNIQAPPSYSELSTTVTPHQFSKEAKDAYYGEPQTTTD